MDGLCKLCNRRPACQDHHIRARGIGGGHTCNHPVNRLPVCVECHNVIHTEGTMGVLLIISARRFGMDQSQARAIIQAELRK